MKRTDLAEAAGILRQMLALIAAAPTDRSSKDAVNLMHALGALGANAEISIATFAFGAPLVAIFGLARTAGASFEAIDAIRQQAAVLAPISSLAKVIADAVVLQALACECRIVADLTFRSREQVDTYRNALVAGFDAAIDIAADAFDQVTVNALVGLQSAVMRDLAARARPLPEMVNYSFPVRKPALWIAERLYGDGARYSEVIAENSVVHPLFMPASGRALSR